MRKKNLIGQKFGMLTIIAQADSHRTPKGKSLIRWRCECQCGKIIECYAMHLKNRKNMSCGCIRLSINRKYDPIKSSASVIYRNGYNDGDISLDEFIALSSLPCHYCGALSSNSYQRAWKKRIIQGEFKYNGLDRVDSSQAHNKDNVVTCCRQCNWAKRDLSLKDFLDWVKKIYEHTNKML